MIYFVYPQLRKLSGAERLILRLAAHLTALGSPVTLVTHHLADECRADLDPRVRVIETGARLHRFRSHYLNAPLEYINAPRLLSRIGAEAEAVTFFGAPSLPALAWSKQILRTRVPHLYFCYEPPRFAYDDTREITARLGALGFAARPFFALYKMLDRAMARRAEVLLANSAFGAQRLRAAYGRAAVVITHGVDLVAPAREPVDALRAKYALQGKCVLLTVAFLHPRKRIDLFLRTLARVRTQMPNVVGLLVGAGPEAAHLQSLARELNLGDAAIFTGFVPDAQLPAHYALAAVYLHTCKMESFGLSVLEASAAGVPVVAVDEGGPREIIVNGETGLLVPATVDALADATRALLRDPARRARMGDAARLRAHGQYSWERGAETFRAVLTTHLKNSNPPRS